jgi:RNA polymerase sigma-70 factor (ECF subfamily)
MGSQATGDSVTAPTHQPDSELDRLARRAGSGNADMIAKLLDAVSPLLVRYCRARMGRRGASYREADEIAQEAGRAVLASVAGYHEGSFLRLVHVIVARTVDELASPGPPDKALGSELMDLLPTLPSLDRDIVVLRVATGLSATETATVLGLTPGEVKVAQHRALMRLRSLL